MQRFFLLGIKGTGMSHLASYLKQRGAFVTGSDVDDDFFTAALLKDIKVEKLNNALPPFIDILIYSASFNEDSSREIRDAKERGITTYSYPEYLALLSKESLTFAVSGTHGKTTTTAYTSFLLYKREIKGASIFGSYLKGYDKSYYKGRDVLLLEACEYKDHYQLYDLSTLAITTIDYDHPDYFHSFDSVKESFKRRIRSLNKDSALIYPSTLDSFINQATNDRDDVIKISIGSNEYKIIKEGERYKFLSSYFETGEKDFLIIQDIVISLVLCAVIILKCEKRELNKANISKIITSLAQYIKEMPPLISRSEVVKESNNITYLCDYAHHPAEIKVCLNNIRLKYPNRRIVVMFMPHTASRSRTFLDEFAKELSNADSVFLEPLYTSMRNDNSDVDLVELLYKKLKRCKKDVYYIKNESERIKRVAAFLSCGDICITMGAGDSRKLIDKIDSCLEIKK